MHRCASASMPRVVASPARPGTIQHGEKAQHRAQPFGHGYPSGTLCHHGRRSGAPLATLQTFRHPLQAFLHLVEARVHPVEARVHPLHVSLARTPAATFPPAAPAGTLGASPAASAASASVHASFLLFSLSAGRRSLYPGREAT